MILSRTNTVLAVLWVLLVTLIAGSRVDYAQPNIELLPDMKYTPARGAYAENSVFANGRTLQAPVPGTVARGQMPLHFAATKEDALRAGAELRNPYHPQKNADALKLPASVLRGGDAFRVFCVSCHGATGAGDGPVAKRGFPPPPSLLTGKSRQMKDGQLFHLLTYGQNTMPDFAGQLAPQRRWDLINYIRNMQSNSPMPVESSAGMNDNPAVDSNSTENDQQPQTVNDK